MGLLDRFKRKSSDDDDEDDDEDGDFEAEAEDESGAKAEADEGDGDLAAGSDGPDDDAPGSEPSEAAAAQMAPTDDMDIRAAVAESLGDMEANADEDDDDDDDEDDEGAAGPGRLAALKARMPRGRKGLAVVAAAAFVLVSVVTGGVAWIFLGGDDDVAEKPEGVVVGLALPPPSSGGLTPPAGGGLNAIGIGAGSETAAAESAGMSVGVGAGSESSEKSGVPNPDGETVASQGLNAFAVETGTQRQAGADITVQVATSAAFDIMLDREPDQPVRSEPDAELLERVDGGVMVPRISGTRTPFETYARAASPPEGAPRIAVVVVGLGHSRAVAEAAIRKLPGAVSLSFDVYATGLDAWLGQAWAHGHEVLLSLPMESARFPNEDAGPLALRTNLTPDDNRLRLNAVMGRFRGYIGLRTVMGSKFMAAEEHIKPVLETLKGRGLMILESDRDPASLVPRLSTEIGLARAFTDVEIDVSPSRAAIAAKLVELESVARQRGAAVGITSGLPSALEVIDAWISDAQSRGFAIVPVSNIAGARRSGT